MLIVKDIPKWKVLSLLLDFKKGTHIHSKYVEYFKVRGGRVRWRIGCVVASFIIT